MKQKILDFYNRLKSIQARSTLIILVIAAVLIETTAMVQYWFASKGIESGAQYRAETELKIARYTEFWTIKSIVTKFMMN